MTRPSMQYAACYSLDLYCDTFRGEDVRDDKRHHSFAEFPHTFTGETFAQCAAQARRQGWVIHRGTHTATCPKCSGKSIAATAPPPQRGTR
jgi:hypothetical protein